MYSPGIPVSVFPFLKSCQYYLPLFFLDAATVYQAHLLPPPKHALEWSYLIYLQSQFSYPKHGCHSMEKCRSEVKYIIVSSYLSNGAQCPFLPYYSKYTGINTEPLLRLIHLNRI